MSNKKPALWSTHGSWHGGNYSIVRDTQDSGVSSLDDDSQAGTGNDSRKLYLLTHQKRFIGLGHLIGARFNATRIFIYIIH